MIDINHIAKLARIGLSEEELKKLETELSAILGFVEKLKEVDINGVEPMARPPLTSPKAMSGAAGGVELVNRMREDEVSVSAKDERKKILVNAPKKKDNYIEVKAVFE